VWDTGATFIKEHRTYKLKGMKQKIGTRYRESGEAIKMTRREDEQVVRCGFMVQD